MLKRKVGVIEKFWNSLKIRWKLLFIILPTAIIPLVIVIAFTSIRIYAHLEHQSRKSYATLLGQVRKNVENVYEQYARTLTNMMKISNVVNGINASPYNSALEENEIRKMVMGDETTEGGFRNTAEEKISGQVIIYETDRKSVIKQTDYVDHVLNAEMPIPRYNLMIEDPLYKRVRNDNSIKLIFGKFQKDVIPGSDSSEKSVLIYPYYPVPPKEGETFNKFVVVIFNPGFIRDLYKDIEELNYGTLYILDRNDNIMSVNHPSSDDYYDYDDDEERYILNGADPDDPYELLKFDDYKMLNTNRGILKTDSVRKILSMLTPEGIQKIFYSDDEEPNIFEKFNYITYNNKTFLTVVEYGESSETKYIYFHPIKQIQKPIFNIIYILLIFAVIFVVAILVISFLLSRSFTNPIMILAEATHLIAKGDYTHLIKKTTNDEIGYLSENFNQMIKNIKSFQDKLLSAEREKSELEVASKIQTCLLPNITAMNHYEVTATMIPAEEVGGDYYDVIGELKDGRIWVGIGDVSGHGLTSGLIMMMAQTGFNTILLNNPDISSNTLISQVNRVMYQNIKQRLGEDHFMTLSFLVGDPDGTIRHAGCHLDLLIYRAATNEVEKIQTNGVWLGLIPDIEANTQEFTFKLEKDDVMLLFTDGLIEAKNIDNVQYDEPRLVEKFRSFGTLPIKDIEKNIIDDVFDFLHEQMDDITFIIIKKK